MNILITGGAGFIGSNLALQLIEKGYSVRILDNLSKQIHGDDPPNTSPLYKSIMDKVDFLKGSVLSKNDWMNALKNIEVIVHFAAETGTGQSMYEIQKYVDVNVNGTAIMLDILANVKHDVKKVIIASSRSIYGEGRYFSEELGYVYPKHRIIEHMSKGDFEVKYDGATKELQVVATDEESKIHPSSVYGITKQNQEQMVMTVCPTIGVASVALRYQNVYGPGQSLSNPYTGILSIFSTQIRNRNPINIFEDGKESRDFVFIDDVVKATRLSIEMEEADGEIFNVGLGSPISVLMVAKTLIDNYKIEVPINITGNYRLGDIRHNFADLTKIKNKLGFVPEYQFSKGVELFTKWVMMQDVMEDKYSESINEMKLRGLYK